MQTAETNTASGPAIPLARWADRQLRILAEVTGSPHIAALEGEQDELKITYLGRKDDLLRIDGDFVAMNDIDNVLKKIPGLTDAAAFATKTSRNEIVPACAIVKVQGSPLNEKQILEHCAQALSGDLCPKAVAFTDAIPQRDAGSGEVHDSAPRWTISLRI